MVPPPLMKSRLINVDHPMYHPEHKHDNGMKRKYLGGTRVTKHENKANRGNTPDRTFESILEHSFPLRKKIDKLFEKFIPAWNSEQRKWMIRHLIHYLELKVAMNEYIPGHLLAPSPLLEQAWRILVLETQLYKKVTCVIQDFHFKPHKMIHYSLDVDRTTLEAKYRRTQSLFQVYFHETMPLSLNEFHPQGNRTTPFTSYRWRGNTRCCGVEDDDYSVSSGTSDTTDTSQSSTLSAFLGPYA